VSKNTPGPWEHEGDGVIVDAAGKQLAMVSPHLREANARLIAAAPELLEACRAALYGVVDRGGPDGLDKEEVADYLRAAITKAEEP